MNKKPSSVVFNIYNIKQLVEGYNYYIAISINKLKTKQLERSFNIANIRTKLFYLLATEGNNHTLSGLR